MKKRYLLIFMIIFLFPFTVNAATSVDVKLECDSSIKKNTEITCKVVGTINEGTLKSFSADVEASGTYFSTGNQSINESGDWSGSNKTLATFNLKSSDTVGSAKVTLSNLKGKDEDDAAVTFNNTSVTKDIKILDNVATLNSIKLDGEEISGFSASSYNYNFSVTKKEIEISASRASSNSTLTGDGTTSLKCGENKIELKVTAEDKTEKTYVLNISRTCSDVSTLKGITLSSGSLSPKFSSDITTYSVSVSKDIDKIIFTPIKDHEEQVITGDVGEKELSYGKNTFKIEVASEKDSTTTYVINVNREDGRDNNIYLKSLSIDEVKIMFDKEKFEYNTKVLYSVKELNITALAEGNKSTVEITGNKDLKVGENKVVVTVISENEEKTDYIINVTRLKAGESLGNNANISVLSIKGYNIKFDADTTEYILNIKNESKLDIDVTLDDETSVYEIIGNKNLKNKSVIKIVVESLDGTTKTYKIIIKKSDNLIPIIIICVSVVIAIGLIILVIINNKKNNLDTNNSINKKENKNKKEKIKTKNINNNDDQELLDKVNEQLNLISDENDTDKLNEYVPSDKIDEAIIEDIKEEESKPEFKVCSLCGHKVPYETEICPYCRKKF